MTVEECRALPNGTKVVYHWPAYPTGFNEATGVKLGDVIAWHDEADPTSVDDESVVKDTHIAGTSFMINTDTPSAMEMWARAIATDIYNDLTDSGRYHYILDLLFDQAITPGKAAEAIAEISLGATPLLPGPDDLPRWTAEPPARPGWYWVRPSPGFSTPRVVERLEGDEFHFIGTDEVCGASGFTPTTRWWSQPITPPEAV
jgi:hypothetical protein